MERLTTAIDALAQLNIHASTEDQWGLISNHVAKVVATYINLLESIETLVCVPSRNLNRARSVRIEKGRLVELDAGLSFVGLRPEINMQMLGPEFSERVQSLIKSKYLPDDVSLPRHPFI